MADEVDFHFLPDFVGGFGPVAAVLFGENDLLETGASGGEDLHLEAADAQDSAAQTDFAGHGEVGADEALGQERGQGDGDGGAGAGTILGGGSGRDMDVE